VVATAPRSRTNLHNRLLARRAALQKRAEVSATPPRGRSLQHATRVLVERKKLIAPTIVRFMAARKAETGGPHRNVYNYGHPSVVTAGCIANFGDAHWMGANKRTKHCGWLDTGGRKFFALTSNPVAPTRTPARQSSSQPGRRPPQGRARSSRRSPRGTDSPSAPSGRSSATQRRP